MLIAAVLAAERMDAGGDQPAHPRRQLQFARLVNAEESCKDERPADCAGWAADGECEANAGFMMSSCAHSCTRCAEGPSGVGVMRSVQERTVAVPHVSARGAATAHTPTGAALM